MGFVSNMIHSIMNDPLPVILQVAGASIGIPPYVTAAAIQGARGGDFEDIVKAAAASYLSSEFLQNTELGTEIRNYTANTIAGDFTDYMIDTFDLSVDTAVTVAKMSTAAMNGVLSGGIRAAILGQNIGDAMATGFSSGLVLSGVDSYFDDLNKDPNWGFSKTTLNIMKGVTSTALNTAISGKGNPAEAVGNYIAYATLKLGASEAKTFLQRAYEDFTGKTEEAQKSQDHYQTVKAEYDAEVRKHDALASSLREQAAAYENLWNTELAPIKQQLDGNRQEFDFQKLLYEQEKQTFEDAKYAYNNYGEWLQKNGYTTFNDNGDPAKLVNAKLDANGNPIIGNYYAPGLDDEGRPIGMVAYYGIIPEEGKTVGYQTAPTQQSFAETANAAATAANRAAELAGEASKKFNELSESETTRNITDRLAAIKNNIENNSTVLRQLRDQLEKPTGGMENPNLAQRLQFAAKAYETKYALWKDSQEAKDRASTTYERIASDVVFRDATIDAINNGTLKVTDRTPDGGFVLSNGMVVKDGKFFENGKEVYTNAAGVPQNALDLVDKDGQVYRYGMDAGRQMSVSDIQNAFRRDYQIELSEQEAQRFVGGKYGTYDQKKFDDFAKERAQQIYRTIAGQPATEEQLQKMVETPNVGQAATTAAVKSTVKDDPSITDNQQALALRENAVRQVINSYVEQGLTAEQITERVDSGQANREVQTILDAAKTATDEKIAAATTAQETYGTGSPEAQAARKEALDSMAETGGYNVTRNTDGSYTDEKVGKLDPDTLVPVDRGSAYIDPVTGAMVIKVVGTADEEREKIKPPITTLWAIGKSAHPPILGRGGLAIFGDGSGWSGGEPIPGFKLIAVDDGMGDVQAKMFDLGSGFTLIAYSDGKNRLIDRDNKVFEIPKPAIEVWLMPPDEAPTPIKDLPVVTTPKLATDGGKAEQDIGEKIVGNFYDVLTDPKKLSELYPKKPEEQKPPESPVLTVPQGPGTAPIQEIKPVETPTVPPQVAEVVDTEKPTVPQPVELKPTEPKPQEPQKPLEVTPEELQKPQEPKKPTEPPKPAEEAAKPTAPTTPEVPEAPAGSTTPTAPTTPTTAPTEPATTPTTTPTTTPATTPAAPTPTGPTPTGPTEEQLKAAVASQVGGVEQRLSDAITQAKQAGLEGDAALQAGINKVAADLSTTKDVVLSQVGKTEAQLRADMATQATALQQQLGQAQAALNKAIADNEAAGLSRDAAITKSVNDVAASLGTTKEALLAQMGTSEQKLRSEFTSGLQAAQQQTAQQLGQTETALRQAIGQLGTDVQSQFNAMDAAQKAEVAARAQQGQDLQAAIGSVAAQTEQKLAQTQAGLEAAIGRLGTDVQAQFSNMDAAQKAEVAARVQQGQDLQSAIANVGAATAQQIKQSEEGLRQAIGQLGTNVQGQFDAMTAAQKAEVAARVQQGQDLQTAIQGVGTQTQQQIAASEAAMREALGNLGTDVRTQFDQMSAAQKAEVNARMQQGQDLRTAITNVGQQTAQQIAESQGVIRGQIATLGEDLQRQYNSMNEAQQAEVAQRVQLGQKLDTAIGSVTSQIGQVESKLTTSLDDLRKRIEEENARKAAADAALKLKTSQEKMVSLGQQAIGTSAGAAETALPTAKAAPLTISTGEAKPTEFQGPLAEFMKQVEKTSYTAPPGQTPMQQTQQPTQVAQQQTTPQQGPNYYSYGVFSDIDKILNPLSGGSMFAASGGLATPLMKQGGLNVVHHAGKQRLDFRQGAAVSGPGDGQSDDIPAMLADGEFVFPADVVAALGNGSTKAGSDKLYEMMHSIRSYHRSAKPEDLPPPAKKSPLDYVKKARR